MSSSLIDGTPQAAYSTKQLTHSFRWTDRRAFQQHDVQEFFSKLFAALESATEGYSMVEDLYQGKMVDFLSCQECDFERRRDEAFRELELEISLPSVLQSLKQCVRWRLHLAVLSSCQRSH